ncbi:hypothetical protein FGG08_000448, partial [Glutinoglossum americanum]
VRRGLVTKVTNELRLGQALRQSSSSRRNNRESSRAARAALPSATQMRKSSSSQGNGNGRGGTALNTSSSKSAKRIYILGVGNVGKLFAQSLADIPDRPLITLLFHRPELASIWKEKGETIELVTNGISKKQGGYEIEVLKTQPDGSHQGIKDMIDCLITTTKAIHVVSALSAIKARLSRDSAILFTQNGMGIVEKVNEELFPNAEDRPNYMLGIVSHGVYSQHLFSSVHAGRGTISLGPVPRNPGPTGGAEDMPPPSRYILQAVLRSPALAAAEVSPTEIVLLQLEKLVANAVINPLTAIFDCKNGQLLGNPHIADLMRLLLSEISLVIRSLPEMRGIPGTEARFSRERLEEVVVGVADKTAENISSMLQDVRARRETEVGYINGYIVKRGEEVGVDCAVNRKVLLMVKERTQISDAQISDIFWVSVWPPAGMVFPPADLVGPPVAHERA